MLQLEQTFSHFLLQHQEKYNRTYHFLILMDAIVTAAKRIQYYYLPGALKGVLGMAGMKNVQGEDVLKMDEIANEITKHYLKTTGRVIYAISEEEKDIIQMNADGGRYFVYFDPMDGSSNVPHNLPIGFLFGVAKRNLEGPEDMHLRAGNEYIAAGMFVIPTGTFTIALRDAGCWRFHIDEMMNYVKPFQMVLPDSPKTWELCYNSANIGTFDAGVQKWIAEQSPKYAFRYMGSLAGDFHRVLANGGLFMYPAIKNHPDPKKNKPKGKLRLMYECSVVSFMAREAGGYAVDESGGSILDVAPGDLHQRTAMYVGSRPLVEDISTVLKKSAGGA
jgi:fructose-1,6-bisphosphatase I